MWFRFRRELGRTRQHETMDEQIDQIQCNVARVAYPFGVACLGALLGWRAFGAAWRVSEWADLAIILMLSVLAFVVMMGRLFGWTPEVSRPALVAAGLAVFVGLAAWASGRLRPDQAAVAGLLSYPVGFPVVGWRYGWFGRLARDEGWVQAQGQALSAAITLLLCLSGLSLVIHAFIFGEGVDIPRFLALFAPMVLVAVMFGVWGGPTPQMYRGIAASWPVMGLGMAAATVLTDGWDWPQIAFNFALAYLLSRLWLRYSRRLQKKVDDLDA